MNFAHEYYAADDQTEVHIIVKIKHVGFGPNAIARGNIYTDIKHAIMKTLSENIDEPQKIRVRVISEDISCLGDDGFPWEVKRLEGKCEK